MSMTDKEKNEKLINILLYTGIYAAIISAIAYLVLTYVIVNGFETAIDREKQILFSLLGAAFGMMITFLLRNQGIALASSLEDSQNVMKAYHEALNKTKPIKKLRTIKFYMWFNTIKDLFTKLLTIAISTFFVLYIFMDGNGDWGLFMLALSNLCMFAGFGLIALAKTYNFYIEEHIPAIVEITNKLKLDQVGSVPPEGE